MNIVAGLFGNLFLAFIPLVLSLWLFLRRSKRRTLLWWMVFVAFISFLPNASYLLTDIIHLIDCDPRWLFYLGLLP